jgi:hypothetical protein
MMALLFVLAGALAGPAAPASAGEWFANGVEVHGFVRSRFHVRTPDFDAEPTASSWRTELNLETDLEIFTSDDWYLNFHALTRPSYEAVFDTQPDLYGNGVEKAEFGTGAGFPDNLPSTRSLEGRGFAGQGGRLRGEFTILNADAGSSFTGKRIPGIAIDDVAVFGGVIAPVNARGSSQPGVGGNATGTTYEGLRDNYGVFHKGPTGLPLTNGGLPLGQGLDASLGLASLALGTPLNFYAGARGDRSSFKSSSFDLNRREDNLKFDCFDNAHSTCMFREFFFDIERGDTTVRLGRQQIVWGKTDFFRLQDVVNPVDLSTHNVLVDLEDRRIPQFALDVVHTFGRIGPVEDFSVELAWVFDKFTPDQFGQCGEAWAFTVACQARADAGAHQLLNVSLARTKDHDWSFSNTQPGARVDFRLPKPAISFSVSAFYGFQKTPVSRFRNPYSTRNPNSAAMLLLQGSADPGFESAANPNGSVALLIDSLSQAAQSFAPPFAHSGGVWVNGFDPYDRTGPSPNPGGTLEAANQDLQNAWYMVTNILGPAIRGCAGVPDTPGGLDQCGATIAPLGTPWAGTEAQLEYPRLFTVGASMDYQIPGIETVLRLEMAGEIGRSLQNLRFDDPDGVTKSSVYKLSVGLDRAFKIPFINPNRPALVSFQTFFQHIVDYEGARIGGDGMVQDENSVTTTLSVRNYWRGDSLMLSNLAVVDWNAGAVLWGPKLRWAYDPKLSFEVGVNLFWGQTKRHVVRDLCADGSLSGSASGCSFADPTTWQDGNAQLFNGPLERTTQSPFGHAQQSFADGFMRRRDEFWMGITYRF